MTDSWLCDAAKVCSSVEETHCYVYSLATTTVGKYVALTVTRAEVRNGNPDVRIIRVRAIDANAEFWGDLRLHGNRL